jgi:hypothetical protein
MRRTYKIIGVAALFSLATALIALPQAASSQSATNPAQQPATESIPAFHDGPPTGDLPETLSPALFNDPLAQNAYTIAARIKKVLYQQPCYCHCDRSQGHTSLLDCFTGRHAAVCGTCVREDFYSYEQSQKGKTPAQIREGIERGDWEKLDVTRYQSPLPVK